MKGKCEQETYGGQLSSARPGNGPRAHLTNTRGKGGRALKTCGLRKREREREKASGGRCATPRPVWWALKTRRKGHLRVWVPGVARLGPSGVAFYAQRARLPPVSSTARSTFPLPGGICDFAGPSQPARGDLSCGSTGIASASPHQARIKQPGPGLHSVWFSDKGRVP